jgi:hypothetical protein
MKRLFYLSALFVFSCGNNSTNQPIKNVDTIKQPATNNIEPSEATLGTFSFTANGQTYNANKLAGATTEHKLSDGILQVVGGTDNIMVELILTDAEAKTGATIKCEGGISFNYNDMSKAKNYIILPNQQGTIKITSRTANKVSGTFYFTAVTDLTGSGNKINVTDGKFNVTIEKED